MPTLHLDGGLRLAYTKNGEGPALILVPGALAMAEDFTTLATLLGRHFTVYTLERRGRGKSSPQDEDYTIEAERRDIIALQKITGSQYLFGHSFGGFAALEAARNNKDFKKIAVYEPGVSVDGSIRTDWISRCEKELASERHHAAFVTFVQGANPQSRKAPRSLLSFILRIVLKKNERQQKYELLSTAIREHLEVARLDNAFACYSEIAANVLCMRGNRGIMTKDSMDILLSAIPNAEAVTIKQANHLTPERKPQHLIDELMRFFK